MDIEKLVQILSNLKFKYKIEDKKIEFIRGDYTITLDFSETMGSRFWTYSVINFRNGIPDIIHLDTFFNTLDPKLLFRPILRIFRDEIRSQKIDSILESNI